MRNGKCASNLVGQEVEWTFIWITVMESECCFTVVLEKTQKYNILKDKLISGLLTPPQTESPTQLKKKMAVCLE